MAKKADDAKRPMKIFLTEDEADRIRLAAALKRQGVGEFVRGVLLAEAERLMAKIDLPPAQSPRRG